MNEVNLATAEKVLEIVDAGLSNGLGVATPGKMCVEAAVCAALGLPHGDQPPCVHYAVRAFKITLNDASWSSNHARAKGLRRVAVAQLGSVEIDGVKFAKIVAEQTIRRVVPVALRAVAGMAFFAKTPHAKALNDAADRCEREGSAAARAAADAAAGAAADAGADAGAAARADAGAAARAAARAAAGAAADAGADAGAAARAAADAAAGAAAGAAAAARAAARAAAAAAADAGADAGADADAAADAVLVISADICLFALRECASPGVALLDQIESGAKASVAQKGGEARAKSLTKKKLAAIASAGGRAKAAKTKKK